MNQFISKEILDELSYCSTLGQSLKQISLSKTPIETIIQDIGKYRANYVDVLVQENLIGSRFKSDDSIYRKYEKIRKNNGGFKQCFNDILEFRLHMEAYPTEFPEYFRVVDLRKGKLLDDGYRAIHLYYQRNNRAYPIEIQLWCGKDYSYNVWSHKHIYKYNDAKIGKELYQLYCEKQIRTEEDFLQKLEKMGGNMHGDKKIYVIAKIFNKQGCIAYSCKTPNEARCLPGTLEAIRAEGVQIVVLDSPEVYPEYAPYYFIEDMKEYIDQVAKLNGAA